MAHSLLWLWRTWPSYLSEELENTQTKLITNSYDLNLWSQEHDLLSKFHMLRQSKKPIRRKELRKGYFPFGDKITTFFQLAVTILNRKNHTWKVLEWMVFGRTTNLSFHRSFTQNSTKDSRRITFCILVRLSLYLGYHWCAQYMPCYRCY